MASGGVIGSLRVNLGLDSAKFERGAKRVSKPLHDMRKQFLAVAGVAAAAGAAISAMALKGAQDIDKSAKAARRLGSSITGFRALELAADEAGVSLSSLTNDVQTIDREIASIGKSGNADRALKALGLSIDDLGGKDADEKLATIADRVKDLGLTTGETTSILRDLGVRNREMVLLVGQGGDALRSARMDIEEYGLAISSVDAGKIETANDQIGRLGLIGQYAGQQLAVALVPAMGAMAQAMTDSLREGGLLRAMIDGLVGNLDVLANSAAVAVTAFGVRYVGAFVLAKLATFSLVGALAALKVALITTGIGALIVGAGYLIAKFSDLVVATGGFGNALALLKDVAIEVWDRIKRGAALMAEGIAGGALSIKAAFADAFATVVEKFAAMTQTIADGWNSVMGTLGIESNAQGLAGGLAEGMRRDADHLRDSAAAFGEGMREAWDGISAPLKSVAALREAMAGAADDTDDARIAADGLADSLDDAADSAGGGGGKKGGLTDKLKDLKDQASETGSTVKNSLGSMIDGLVDGSLNGVKALEDLGKSLLALALKTQIFKGLAGAMPGIFGSGGFAPLVNAKGNIFSGGNVVPFANGGIVNSATLFSMRNGTGLMGEAGPEAIMPLARGADGKLGVRGGGGGTIVQINNYARDTETRERRQQGPNGEEIILDIVNKGAQAGQLTGVSSRFGLRDQKVKR